ncbi:MAG: 4a-hydroxytetrahydrobiopterin dehydratase [Deltaproteobacteria bacterium]|nr:4a-hydroxytetrahydrobiopterin dehydratase [Deltaproteobacteria bacterium]MCX7952558.1 4a-hydroxytetrahydrobiopterin dehydratase [Deltaproteobacteria bacterium]
MTATPKNWHIVDNKLELKLEFANHLELAGFLVKLIILSEKYNHHPECYFNYKKLVIKLYTHSENRITDKDYELAEKINLLLKEDSRDIS